jgi:hypothetical protein
MMKRMSFGSCVKALAGLLIVIAVVPASNAAEAEWQDPAWQQKVWDAAGPIQTGVSNGFATQNSEPSFISVSILS